MSDAERALRSNCPHGCPCLCHDGFGGAHPNERCAEAEADWHWGGLGLYRHAGPRDGCTPCRDVLRVDESEAGS